MGDGRDNWRSKTNLLLGDVGVAHDVGASGGKWQGGGDWMSGGGTRRGEEGGDPEEIGRKTNLRGGR